MTNFQLRRPLSYLGHSFVTLTVDNCVQHGGPEVLRRAGLSAASFKSCPNHIFVTDEAKHFKCRVMIDTEEY